MPIRRWRGWYAICPDCGKAVDLRDGVFVFAERREILDALNWHTWMKQDDLIRKACGCARKEEKKS